MEEHLQDYKDYVEKHFDYNYSCEDPIILSNLHLAQQKVYNWLGWRLCGCDSGCDCCNDIVLNAIYTLTFYYTTVDYNEDNNNLEMTAYLMLKNAGLISF